MHAGYRRTATAPTTPCPTATTGTTWSQEAFLRKFGVDATCAPRTRLTRLDRDGHSPARKPLPKQDGVLGGHVRRARQCFQKARSQSQAFHRQGRSGRSRTPLGRYRQEPHAVRQPLLLGRLFPRQRDRTRPRLSRLRNGRPVVRGEFDVLMRVAAHRSHNLTDAIESLPSGLHRPKHKEHHDTVLVMRHRRKYDHPFDHPTDHARLVRRT